MDVGIVAGVSIGSVFLTLVIVSALYERSPKEYSGGPKVYGRFEYFTLANWFKILYFFLPYALFLFGVIYDGLARQIRLFPAGFVGLANVFLNSTLSWLLNGRVAVTDSDICGIPGMSSWGSDIAPQNILFTSTVLSYIASYIASKPYIPLQWVGVKVVPGQSDLGYTLAPWAGVIGIWFLQTIAFNWNKCNIGKDWKFSGGYSFLTSPFYALAGGMLVGGLAGWGVSTTDTGAGIQPDLPKPSSGVSTSKPAMGSTEDTPGAGKCSPTGDDDQFVCEAYKNGELVTSTIVE